MAKSEKEQPQNPMAFDIDRKARKPQEYYERIKEKFADERDIRLAFRPEGTDQFTTELTGDLAKYAIDPNAEELKPREILTDTVECLFIGGGFSALLTSARLREIGVESIRIVERGADVGGTWYWNRYPGVACDVVAYDYLPLLDEMNYIPSRHYAKGDEIYGHCQSIARKYDLYELAVFQTTVTSTLWDEDEQMWNIVTDRGDQMKARFVICANGTLSKPKLSKIQGMKSFAGHSFHTSRWDYDFTKPDLSGLADKTVGIIGTGASAVQSIPKLGAVAKELYVFQRTPSSIDIKNDWPTDPEWAKKLQPGWQAIRRARAMAEPELSAAKQAKRDAMTQEQKVQRQENANIDAMMRIHKRIDEIVEDPETAESLKPWYMLMCKRPCFDNDYLPIFNRDSVHLVDTKGKGIKEIREAGPVFEDEVYPLDVLIYATGFEVQKTGIYNEIRGVNGVEINEKYKDGIRTVLGIHSHGYPNLFIMGGYQATFRFNLTDVLQSQGDHIAACIDYARRNGHHAMDATYEAEERWVQEVIANRGKTTRAADCTPGYYNFEGQHQRRQDGNFNGSYPKYIAHAKDVLANMKENFEFTNPAASG